MLIYHKDHESGISQSENSGKKLKQLPGHLFFTLEFLGRQKIFLLNPVLHFQTVTLWVTWLKIQYALRF